MWAHVRGITCCMPHVLFTERAERVHGTIRSGWPAWRAAQVRCASDVTGDLAARRPGKQRTLSRVGNSPKASACCNAQGDDKAPGIVRRKGRTSESQTATLAVQEKKRPRSKYTARTRMWQASSPGQRSLVRGKGLAIDRPASWGRNSSSWGPWNS